MLAALRFSHVGAAVLIAGGLTACLISIGALRLMEIYWRGRVGLAAQKRMAHLVRPRLDVYGQVLWYVVYTLGGLAVAWGVWALDA